VWADSEAGTSDVKGARVTPEGVVLDPGGFGIATSAAEEGYPVLAGSGDLMVIWENHVFDTIQTASVLGARISASGALEDEPHVISQSANGQLFPVVGSNGEGYLVVWNDFRVAARRDLYAARSTRKGSFSTAPGSSLRRDRRTCPLPSSHGTGRATSWPGRTRKRGSPKSTPRASPRADPSSMRTASGCPIRRDPRGSWRRGRERTFRHHLVRANGVYAASLVSADARVGAPELLSNPLYIAGQAAIASSGSGYYVVWQDYSRGSIYGVRLTAAGRLASREFEFRFSRPESCERR
jgi:hypothetical protein